MSDDGPYTGMTIEYYQVPLGYGRLLHDPYSTWGSVEAREKAMRNPFVWREELAYIRQRIYDATEEELTELRQ